MNLHEFSLADTHKKPPVFWLDLADTATFNAQIINAYVAVKDEADTRKTHHFMGRFENTYISLEQIPAIAPLLQLARNIAAEFVSMQPATLKMGFWFNEMHKGHQTSLHTHEEDDELLSAVYYIKAPKDSGDLVVTDNNNDNISIAPVEGRIIFFRPEVPHRVTENRSDEMRLSVAMNFGKKHDLS